MNDTNKFMSWYLREHGKLVDLDYLIQSSKGTTVDEVMEEVNLKIGQINTLISLSRGACHSR